MSIEKNQTYYSLEHPYCNNTLCLFLEIFEFGFVERAGTSNFCLECTLYEIVLGNTVTTIVSFLLRYYDDLLF